MSDLSPIARPYAKAVFDLATESKEYSSWSDALDGLSSVVQNEQFVRLVSNPRVPAEGLGNLLIEAVNGLSDDAKNLVRVMASNGRLLALPALADQFKVMRDNAEQVIEAMLITATAVDAAQISTIEKALAAKLGKQIKLTSSIDEDLIGGAVIRAGDWVVDGSVKAQLSSLVSAINA